MRTATTRYERTVAASPSISETGRLANAGFYLFLLALALAPLLGGTPVGYEYAMAAWGGDSMSGVLRALILAAALLTTALGPRTASKPTMLTTVARYAVYGTALWVVLSLVVHSQFFTSPVYVFAMLPEALNWLVFATAFTLAARFSGQEKANLPRMTTALLVGGVLCALVGVVSFGAVPGAERVAHRESATFFSPNFAAGFAALILPATVAMFVAAEGLIGSVVAGSATALLFALLMMTGSRAGLALTLAGLGIALVLTLIRGGKLPWQRIAVVVALFGVVAILFGAPMLGRVIGAPAEKSSGVGTSVAVASTDSSTSGEHSGAFRKETWRGSLAMATANPVFGAGPGTFPYTYPRYARVGWTGQAHSSYLQLASESGFPALIALFIGVGATLVRILRERDGTTYASPIIVFALCGGIVAAAGRSVFDSEWVLLACGVPFFAVLGMLLGSTETGDVDATAAPVSARIGTTLFFVSTLLLTFIVRASQAERDRLTVLQQTDPSAVNAQAKVAASQVRPADPQIYALAGDFATAKELSPSGRRLFQYARAFERQNDWKNAINAYELAANADPNNLQTRKALAEAQEKAGDAAGALSTYSDMIKIAEGPAGKIRAIPELVDTLPAFAYAALGEDALKQGKVADAERMLRIARTIIEEYSHTTLPYQISEVATLGANAPARRAEVRALYTDRILPKLRELQNRAAEKTDSSLSPETEAATVARLDAFFQPQP